MIDKEQLKAALDILTVVAPSKTTMPILKYLLLKTDGNKLAITANNLAQALTIFVDQSDEEINTCLPANELKLILQTVKSETVRFKQSDHKIVLCDGKHRTTFKTLDVEKFPVTETVIPQFNIDGGILKTYIEQAQISCAIDESRGILTSVNLLSKNGIFIAQASDGFRASLTKMMLGTDDFNVSIPAPHVKILQLFAGSLSLHIAENTVYIFSDDFQYTTQLKAGQFPFIENFLPTHKNITATINKSSMLNAIKRAMVFAKNTDNIISFNFNDGILNVFSEDNTGKNAMEFEIDQDGQQQISIAANGNFIQDILKLAKNNIIIEMIDATSPIVFKIPEQETFTYILMPMNIK